MNKIGDSAYWMRPISFVGLYKIIQIFNNYPSGLRARDLDIEILRRQSYTNILGKPVSRTTLYHCRNALIKLGIVTRLHYNLKLNKNNEEVKNILSQICLNELSLESKKSFGRLVFENKECFELFFHMFVGSNNSFNYFQNNGCSVSWQWKDDNRGKKVCFFCADRIIGELNTPSQIKSILYGLRYWAKDELNMIDEYFREDRQNIMYPLRESSVSSAEAQILANIMSVVGDQDEWTTLSIQDLITNICEKMHLPIKFLFSTLKKMSINNSGYVVFIPTSERIASLTAATRAAENMRLRSYYQDQQGRFISHIRIHRDIKKEKV